MVHGHPLKVQGMLSNARNIQDVTMLYRFFEADSMKTSGDSVSELHTLQLVPIYTSGMCLFDTVIMHVIPGNSTSHLEASHSCVSTCVSINHSAFLSLHPPASLFCIYPLPFSFLLFFLFSSFLFFSIFFLPFLSFPSYLSSPLLVPRVPLLFLPPRNPLPLSPSLSLYPSLSSSCPPYYSLSPSPASSSFFLSPFFLSLAPFFLSLAPFSHSTSHILSSSLSLHLYISFSSPSLSSSPTLSFSLSLLFFSPTHLPSFFSSTTSIPTYSPPSPCASLLHHPSLPPSSSPSPASPPSFLLSLSISISSLFLFLSSSLYLSLLKYIAIDGFSLNF